MQVTRDMKIKEVLAIGGQMLDALVFLAPEFERLNYPKLRRAMSGRVTVEQAARIAKIPLAAAIYVLNMAAGADSAEVNAELETFAPPAFEYTEENPPRKPVEIATVTDTDPHVTFVDVMDEADRHVDPMPRIAKGLVTLKTKSDVLLITSSVSIRSRCATFSQNAVSAAGPRNERPAIGTSIFTGQSRRQRQSRARRSSTRFTRWLRRPAGFENKYGKHHTYQTT